MADFSKIVLTFTADLVATDSLTIGYGFGDIEETWVDKRTGPNKVTIGTPIGGSDGERSAINFLSAVTLDYSFLPFSITRVGNVVTIISNEPDYSFTWDAGNPGSVNEVITNSVEDVLTIDDISYAEAIVGDPQDFVLVQVTTSVLATTILRPVEIDDNEDNPFTFEIARGVPYTIAFETALGQYLEQSFLPVPVVNSANIAIEIESTPSGANIFIGVGSDLQDNEVLTYEYSLNGIDWQEDPEFVGIEFDDHTLYVRDQLGGITEVAFTTDPNNINTPYTYVPKTNSIRFKNEINWGDCSNYKNDDNTLSCEVDVPLPYQEIQQFQSCDIITTQFRSNYQTQVAKVHIVDSSSGLSTATIPVNQMSNNIGLKDRRDGRIFPYEGISFSPMVGIYFTSGNLYDYDSGADIGDYVLNGALPVWGQRGNYVYVGDGVGGGSWRQIIDIVYDEARQAEVLIVNMTYTGVETVRNLRCIYNLANYEVYEFTIDMVTYLNKKIQVEIQNNDSFFANTKHLSEIIEVKVRHLNTVEIRYWNKHNTDILYYTGIRHKLRILLEKVAGKPRESNEIHITDTNVVLLSSEIHEVDVFEFQPVTKAMMWLIVKALSHSNVVLDGVDYVKDGDIKVEGPLEETNLYIVEASMIKARDIYSSDSGVGEFNQGNIEIPALIGGGNDFVKYQ